MRVDFNGKIPIFSKLRFKLINHLYHKVHDNSWRIYARNNTYPYSKSMEWMNLKQMWYQFWLVVFVWRES